jgi:hypothetical protein
LNVSHKCLVSLCKRLAPINRLSSYIATCWGRSILFHNDLLFSWSRFLSLLDTRDSCVRVKRSLCHMILTANIRDLGLQTLVLGSNMTEGGVVIGKAAPACSQLPRLLAHCRSRPRLENGRESVAASRLPLPPKARSPQVPQRLAGLPEDVRQAALQAQLRRQAALALEKTAPEIEAEVNPPAISRLKSI